MGDEQIKSRYRPLAVPEFRSTIPPHLLAKLEDQERYLVETLSKFELQNHWLVVAAVEANAAIIELDGRQTRVELWKERLTSKWALIIGLLVLVAPVVLKALADRFLGKKP
jgi:hypothetical protein